MEEKTRERARIKITDRAVVSAEVSSGTLPGHIVRYQNNTKSLETGDLTIPIHLDLESMLAIAVYSNTNYA